MVDNESLVISPKPRQRSMDLINVSIQNARKKVKNKIVVLGLCGGHSSGKSKIAEYYKRNLPHSEIIAEKDFFKTIRRKRKFSEADDPLIGDTEGYDHERKELLTDLSEPQNYDHEHLIKVLNDLIQKQKVKYPFYDEEKNTFHEDQNEINPEKMEILILEGTFIFNNETIRNMLDVKVYSEVEDDVRLSRLLLKENKFLNNNPKAIEIFFSIYQKYLKPSYENYVLRHKVIANYIFPNYVVDANGEITEDFMI
ncbi:MAG: hypothetical protein MJ252_27285 [archaeon]|nr:hypothetical protein [archaeon]